MNLTKQDIDKVRGLEGFPIGDDEEIIKLSNAPYYTACPNPFIKDFVDKYGQKYNEELDNYKREPFAADVSEGKSDHIYNAHAYHTKVPYKAIMRYILHYTEPDDIVMDGFGGTGMTGVAAQLCANPDLNTILKIEKEMGKVNWGGRKAIINDLSPIASFITANYNKSINSEKFFEAATEIMEKCERKLGWMYETKHNTSKQLGLLDTNGIINYMVWSDVFICPNCGEEIVFYNVAMDKKNGKVSENFICNSCGIELVKKRCSRAESLVYDEIINKNIKLIKQKPVLINYSFEGKKYNKVPDEFDLENLSEIDKMKINKWIPIERMCEGKETRRNDKIGLEYVHQYFYKRTLVMLAEIFSLIEEADDSLLKIVFTSQLINISKMNRFRPGVSFPYNPLSGTMYISSLISEANPLIAYKAKVKKFTQAIKDVNSENIRVSCGSLTSIPTVPDNSIDYIFTDPPFGDNLNYSELSFIWESWLKVKTNNLNEAVINSKQDKGIFEYQELMYKSFSEYYRVLKPNRWMTVEFHNSKNSVWNAIQEGLIKAGFIVADVRTLDKQQGSFKQVTNESAVKQDLIISVYKPSNLFLKDIKIKAGTIEGVWSFVTEHLKKLPVVVNKNNKLEVLTERQGFLLFDRMIGYHVINGYTIPIDASDFYEGLNAKFKKRDDMYFLDDQITEYDTARILCDVENIQFSLFINNEKNAIAWLYNELQTPEVYSKLQPKFMKEAKFAKYEKVLELKELLEENFLCNSEGKWYIPDIKKQGDVVKLREKRLKKEFDEYLVGKGKLKVFRTEAIRIGFSKLWKEKKYEDIIKVARRLPESIIQEDDKLLMYYDISLNRVE